jgi:hypothetical protein
MVSRWSKRSSNNDDYNEMFLVAALQSQQSALLPLLLSQAKLKQFLSNTEVRRQDRRITHPSPIYSTNLNLSVIVTLHIPETGRLLNYETEGLLAEDHGH